MVNGNNFFLFHRSTDLNVLTNPMICFRIFSSQQKRKSGKIQVFILPFKHYILSYEVFRYQEAPRIGAVPAAELAAL